MSVLIRFAPTSTTTQQYDEVIRKLEGEGDWPPDGLEYHCCFLSDGIVRVSEVWDSRAQLDAFGQRLMPVLDAVGIDPGQPEILDVHNIVKR
jgi:hypothetical protein